MAKPIIALIISCALGAIGGGLLGYGIGYSRGYTTAKDEITGTINRFIPTPNWPRDFYPK